MPARASPQCGLGPAALADNAVRRAAQLEADNGTAHDLATPGLRPAWLHQYSMNIRRLKLAHEAGVHIKLRHPTPAQTRLKTAIAQWGTTPAAADPTGESTSDMLAEPLEADDGGIHRVGRANRHSRTQRQTHSVGVECTEPGRAAWHPAAQTSQGRPRGNYTRFLVPTPPSTTPTTPAQPPSAAPTSSRTFKKLKIWDVCRDACPPCPSPIPGSLRQSLADTLEGIRGNTRRPQSPPADGGRSASLSITRLAQVGYSVQQDVGSVWKARQN